MVNQADVVYELLGLGEVGAAAAQLGAEVRHLVLGPHVLREVLTVSELHPTALELGQNLYGWV